MSLVLKSNQVFTGTLIPEYDAYITRVLADGGEIYSTDDLFSAFVFAKLNGLDKNNSFSVTSASWGRKLDDNGNLLVLYSLFAEAGDIIPSSSGGALEKLEFTDGRPVFASYSASNYAVTKGAVDKPSGIFSTTYKILGGSSPLGAFYSEDNPGRRFTLINTASGVAALCYDGFYGQVGPLTGSLVGNSLSAGAIIEYGTSALSGYLNGEFKETSILSGSGYATPSQFTLGTRNATPEGDVVRIGEAWALCNDVNTSQAEAISARLATQIN